MNDPNKRIDVNISSLLSLKAELLRKQEEVNKAKIQQSSEEFVPKKSSSKSDKFEKNKKSDTKSENQSKDTNNVEEYEDSALLEKSRKVLQAKSRFYEKMASSGGVLNSDDNCLVLFNQKKQETKNNSNNNIEIHSESNSSIEDDSDKEKDDNSNDEWVEYTDCLGRHRKCLKKDLEFFKKKDMKLAENIQPRIELNQNAPMWKIDTKPNYDENKDNISEMTSVMSKHDQMKLNWEKKEEENYFKENVHYQDVLFDEARQHGVGYYAFSTDDEERAKQRKALDELREKTLAEQKQRESQREQREKMIAERVKAAKNRQRARLGLPPLEDGEAADKSESASEKLYNTKEEEKQKKKQEKERRKKEKQEKLKEQERKNHIRPWDKNKDGVINSKLLSKNKDESSHDDDDDSDDDTWKYKPEREPMSQEQWNEMKRNERNMEFAPMQQEEKSIRSFRSQPDYKSIEDRLNEDISVSKNLYFTTKKVVNEKDHREFKKRNYSSINNDDEIQRIPIRNELEDNENEYKDGRDSNRGDGIEIPPPPTYEYYGPSGNMKRNKLHSNTSLQDSIEAGLRFIREKSDKGILPTKSSWSANMSNTDY